MIALLQVTVHTVGDRVLAVLDAIGRFILFFLEAARAIFAPPFRFRLIAEQMEFVGVKSILIIMLTGCFSGMVLGLQSGRAFRIFATEGLTGAVVALSLTRELAPVMASLMVTARAGSAMAAQLGTMQVTQQIDALAAMAVNPMSYLVGPRIVATVLMMPILTGLFNLVGILGAYVVAVFLLRINEAIFIEKILLYVEYDDLHQGLVKSMVFGLLIAWVGCYRGYFASGGAEGVGRATTGAVVIASVAILVSDYFLTVLLF